MACRELQDILDPKEKWVMKVFQVYKGLQALQEQQAIPDKREQRDSQEWTE